MVRSHPGSPIKTGTSGISGRQLRRLFRFWQRSWQHCASFTRTQTAMRLVCLKSLRALFFPLSPLLTCSQKTQQSTSAGAICRRDESPIATAWLEGHVASRQTNSHLEHRVLESYLLDGHAAKKFPLKQRAALRQSPNRRGPCCPTAFRQRGQSSAYK